MSKQKIALFGNSNCILNDGVASCLRKLDYEVLSCAIGGSPSPSHIYQLLRKRKEIENCDLLLIEPSVIDRVLGADENKLNTLRNYVRGFVNLAVQFEKPILLLDLPVPQNLRSDSPASAVWRSEISAVGGKTINCFSLLGAFCDRYGIGDPMALYRDGMGHHKAEVHRWIAGHINECIAALNANDRPIPAAAAPGSADGYEIIGAIDVARHSWCSSLLIERETRLGRHALLPLNQGQAYRVPVRPGYKIIGAMWNYGEMCSTTPCSIDWNVDGKITKLKHSSSFLTKEPRKTLTLMFQGLGAGLGLSLDNLWFGVASGGVGAEKLELAGFLIEPTHAHGETGASAPAVGDADFNREILSYIERHGAKLASELGLPAVMA